MHSVAFESLPHADLIVDAVYEGGAGHHTAADPLARLLRVANQGGFRIHGTARNHRYKYAVLYTTNEDRDWPDVLDPETGRFYYYGDNKQPGRALHVTPRGGNELLRHVFEATHSDPSHRRRVPPFFIFEKEGTRRNVIFRGLAVPGAEELGSDRDLIAVWRTQHGRRFQNYRAVFSILDVARIPRAWITALEAGQPLDASAPGEWVEWVTWGVYKTLRAPRTIQYRSKNEQLPQTKTDWTLLTSLYSHFAHDPFAFEECAAHLWRMVAPQVSEYQVTRRSVDGGRDVVGLYSLGPASDPVTIDFSIEAKCYEPGHSVGVKELARLISRLRHRQFGVLVTTSFLGRQAYEELRSDRHPVVVVSAVDIVRILREAGYGSLKDLKQWLGKEFPIGDHPHQAR